MFESSSNRIRYRDEALLEWFFTRGLAQFERSTFGAMIEALRRDKMGATRCRTCKGVGILQTRAAVERHRQRYRPKSDEERHSVWVWVSDGTYVDPSIRVKDPARWDMLANGVKNPDGSGAHLRPQIEERPAVHVIGSECQLCRGSGWVPKKRPSKICPDCAGLRKAEKAKCMTCRGRGRLGYDARPRAAHEESEGVAVDGDVLQRYAIVSRNLSRLSRAHRETLAIYYGQRGLSWGSTPHGRFLALQAGTAAGSKLLERTRVKGDEATEASEDERMANLWDAQRKDPKTWRYDLLEQAQLQAHRRLEEAGGAWVAASSWAPGAPGDWRNPRGVMQQFDEICDEINETAERVEQWNDAWRGAPTQGADGIWRAA